MDLQLARELALHAPGRILLVVLDGLGGSPGPVGLTALDRLDSEPG